jgi:Leucine-rich repeat (LRR) protein
MAMSNWSYFPTSGVMQIVKDLTALRSLSIGRCKKMTPEGLMHLQHLTGLTKLDLTGVAVITDEILQTICQRSSSIQVLRLGRCTQRLTDKGFEAVGTLRALVELDLRATRITSAGTSHFTSLTGLQILDLKRCPAIQQATFEHIAVLTNLRILNISKCMLLTAPHTTEVTNKLSSLCNLTVFKASYSKFWDETLSAILPGMTCLETLDLSHNRLLNGGFISSIPPSVTELSLEGLLLDDDIVPVSDVWALSRLVNLTRLDFSHTADNIATYAKSLHSLARLEYLFFAVRKSSVVFDHHSRHRLLRDI